MPRNEKLDSEDVRHHIASAELVLLVTIEVAGFILNSAVLLIIYLRYKYLQDKTRYILLLNILLCDYILLCFIIPTSMKFASCDIDTCRALVLESFCSSITLLFEFSYICSFCTQACLAIDTVLKVRHYCTRFLSHKNYWTAVGISWLVSLLPTIISRLPNMNRANVTFYVDLQRCADYDVSDCFYQIYILSFLHVLVAPIIPGCYFYLAVMAKRLKTRLKNSQSQHLLPMSEDSSSASSNTDNSPESNIPEGEMGEMSQSKRSSMRGSVLLDIKHLFAIYHEKHPKAISNRPYSSAASNRLTPMSKVQTLPTESPLTQHHPFSEILSRQTLQNPSPLGEINSPSSKRLLDFNENPFKEGSSPDQQSSKRVHLASKSTQTSFAYESNSSESMPWDNSSSSLNEISWVETKSSQPPQIQHDDPLDKVSKETNVRKSTRISTDTSLEPWEKKRRSKQFRALERIGIETPADVAKSQSKKVLDQAAYVLFQHGLLLMTMVYGCSVPYILVNTCYRLDLPWPTPNIAVCLYYSTCVWYPLVYFFMSANFRKQLSMTTTGG
ncbi:hypothetical protein EGW08_004784 [Elysia chlorotica]|uniref:G-protein coupled receptors family 1 profile domain-containing protein n=1 Tax=Elysia chlorotica TaxID=188477 RepID=A0A3S1HWE0_ELYCH|nr:hypothetical protein EGW08_004784 [Elysia chlorotica]